MASTVSTTTEPRLTTEARSTDARLAEGRATRGMDRYAVRLVGGSVAVDVDKLYQEDTDLAQWQQAVVTLP